MIELMSLKWLIIIVNIIITIIVSSITVFAGVLVVHQGIKGADLKNESLLQIFAAVCGTLM